MTTSTFAGEDEPPASSEVTLAMKPYLDEYKLAGFIAIIADRTGKVHYKDVMGYGLILANDGELEGRRYLSHAAMDDLRKEQTGKTKINSLGYHLRNGLFGHDGAYGTDLSVNPKTGVVAIFMMQCASGDQWAARDLFLKGGSHRNSPVRVVAHAGRRAHRTGGVPSAAGHVAMFHLHQHAWATMRIINSLLAGNSGG